ncbi:MAG: DUF4870 domain-containing protein [Saprospiraceae bacterium]
MNNFIFKSLILSFLFIFSISLNGNALPLVVSSTPISTDVGVSKSKKKFKKGKIYKFIKSIADDDEKKAAIVAYITLIGFLISMFSLHKEGDKLSAFHLRQSLGLMVVGLCSSILLFIPILGWLAYGVIAILLLISWIIGLVSAINEEKKEVFFFGKAFQKWFKNIK